MKTTVKLKDIASYSKGSQINGDDLIEDGVYEYLNGGINPSGKWNEYNVDGNTITISEGENSCGYVNYMINPFWCGAHCYYLFDLKCSPKYLYYALKGHQNDIMRLRSGACMPNIKKKDLGDFSLSIDLNKKEQEKVIEIFDRISAIITHRQKQLEKLDELIKARFVEMFGECKNRISMADLCSIITDGTHQPPKFQLTGIPFILVSNLSENKVTYNTEKYISDETYEELYKRTPIEKGDILLSTVGSYGHPAVVVEDRKFLFQRHIAYLKPKQELINSIYLHSAILSPYIQKQIEERVKGIAQKTLNLSEIRKISVPVPNMDLQTQFADFVNQIDKSKVVVQKHLEKAQLLFDSLMQEYFG